MRDEFGRFTGMFILVTFDIMEKPDTSAMRRRMYRVVKILKGFGKRVQKSVFECYLDNPQIEILRNRLSAEMDSEQGDNIRFYPLCNSCFEKIAVLGEKGVSEDEELFLF